MKSSLKFFTFIVLVGLLSCAKESADNSSIDENLTPVESRTKCEPTLSCGPPIGYHTNDFLTLCDFNTAILNDLNTCNVVFPTPPTCISRPIGTPIPKGFKLENGSLVIDIYSSEFIDAYYAASIYSYFPTPVCYIGEDCIPTTLLTLDPCGTENPQIGWAVSSAEIQLFRTKVFEFINKYASRNLYCGVNSGYSLVVTDINFMIDQLTLCIPTCGEDCWPDNYVSFYQHNCTVNFLFNAKFSCCKCNE